MGFGLLFIGYLLAFFLALTKFGFAIRLLGYAIIAWSLIKLRDYEPKFTYPQGLSFLLVIIGVFNFLLEGAAELAIALPEWMSASDSVVDWAEFIVDIALNITLLWVIAEFAHRLDLRKQRVAALRNMIFVGAYFILYFLGSGPMAGNERFQSVFALPMLIIQLFWIFLNLALIFSCYMYICPEGDEDMPRRRSRFKFINKIKEESDRRVEMAKRETEKYISEQNNKENKQDKKNKK